MAISDLFSLFPNYTSAIGGGAVTAFFTYAITRVSKRYDARGAAEAALIGSGPAIIQHQNDRIQHLEDNYLIMWDRLGESINREQQCQRDLSSAREELSAVQSDLNTVTARIAILERASGHRNDTSHDDE